MPTQPRFVTHRLIDALKVSPVVFLNGARQSGKSTLVQSISAQIGGKNLPAEYITFDSPTNMAAASAAPVEQEALLFNRIFRRPVPGQEVFQATACAEGSAQGAEIAGTVER